MSRWVRWQGLLAFAVLSGGLLALWLFLVDGFVKRIVEKTGTALVGARVELEKADLGLSPLGLTLMGLQVTDPDEPMRNAVEVDRIAFLADGLNLLRRKVTIEEMTVEGMRFGTERKYSGAVTGKQAVRPATGKVPASGERFEFPSVKLPDVEEILDKEALDSLRLADEIKSSARAEEERLRAAIKGIPTKDDIGAYRKRLKGIEAMAKKGGISSIQAVKEASDLNKDIKGELKAIKEARAGLSAGIEGLRLKIGQIEEAGKGDVSRLMKKYAPGVRGLSSVSEMLFGPRIADYTRRVLRWHFKFSPAVKQYLQRREAERAVRPVRAKGLDIVFPERNHVPDFLIRTLKASVSVKAGDISGTVENITPEQALLGQPTSFFFEAENLTGMDSVEARGTLDHRPPEGARDELSLSMRGLRLRDVALSKGRSLPVSLKSGVLDMDLRAAVKGKALSSALSASLGSARLFIDKKKDKDMLVEALGSALSEVSGFKLYADISGTLDDYDIKVSSDLDHALRGTFERLVRKHSERLEKDLRASVEEKLKAPMQEILESMGGIKALGAGLSSKENELEGVMKEALRVVEPKGIKLPF